MDNVQMDLDVFSVQEVKPFLVVKVVVVVEIGTIVTIQHQVTQKLNCLEVTMATLEI